MRCSPSLSNPIVAAMVTSDASGNSYRCLAGAYGSGVAMMALP